MVCPKDPLANEIKRTGGIMIERAVIEVENRAPFCEYAETVPYGHFLSGSPTASRLITDLLDALGGQLARPK